MAKHFLIFSQYFPPEIGASQTRLAALARALKASGHEVEIVTALPHHLKGRIFSGYRGKLYVRDSWEGITVHRTWLYASPGSGVLQRLLNYCSFAATALFGLLRAQKADYIFVESPPLFLILPAVAFSMIRKVSIILNVADLWPESVKMLGVVRNPGLLALAGRLESWAYGRSRYVNAVTEGIQRRLRERPAVAESSLLFLPNGVDTSHYYPRPPDSELVAKLALQDKKVFIYAGTHGLAYKLDLLLDLAQRLEDRNIAVLLVGDGFTKAALIKRATEHGIRNIIFVDSQPESEMPRYFSLACGSILPLTNNPLFEGTRPAKLFTSLASGVPVVYSGTGEGSRILLDAKAGLVVPPESLKDIEDAVLTLATNPVIHRQMADSGRSYVTENFKWDNLVGKWLSELRERESHRGVLW